MSHNPFPRRVNKIYPLGDDQAWVVHHDERIFIDAVRGSNVYFRIVRLDGAVEMPDGTQVTSYKEMVAFLDCHEGALVV